MASVILGNTAPIDTARPDPAVDSYERVPLDIGVSETAYHIPTEVGIAEALKTISDTYGAYHSDNLPAWVESDDTVLAEAIARVFSTEEHTCELGRPNDWGNEWINPDTGNTVLEDEEQI